MPADDDVRWSWRTVHASGSQSIHIEPEHVLAWGYDEDWEFMEQDEDLLLREISLADALASLAGDYSCPKQRYAQAILDDVFFDTVGDVPAPAPFLHQIMETTSPFLEGWRDRSRLLLDLLGDGIRTPEQAREFVVTTNQYFATNPDRIVTAPLFDGILLAAPAMSDGEVHEGPVPNGFFFVPQTGRFQWGPADQLPFYSLRVTWAPGRSAEDVHSALARLTYPYSQRTGTRETRQAIIDAGQLDLGRHSWKEADRLFVEMRVNGLTVERTFFGVG